MLCDFANFLCEVGQGGPTAGGIAGVAVGAAAALAAAVALGLALRRRRQLVGAAIAQRRTLSAAARSHATFYDGGQDGGAAAGWDGGGARELSMSVFNPLHASEAGAAPVVCLVFGSGAQGWPAARPPSDSSGRGRGGGRGGERRPEGRGAPGYALRPGGRRGPALPPVSRRRTGLLELLSPLLRRGKD